VQKDVSLGLLRKLAKTLGVTADWLIGMYEDEEESEGADVALVG
jgi:hypothetical protein